MPVRRGHVALQNTYLDTIIRKFDGQISDLDQCNELICALRFTASWAHKEIAETGLWCQSETSQRDNERAREVLSTKTINTEPNRRAEREKQQKKLEEKARLVLSSLHKSLRGVRRITVDHRSSGAV
ncbi:potassium voltage-gated channel subfamily H member 6-like [Tachysurus ichikawai]